MMDADGRKAALYLVKAIDFLSEAIALQQPGSVRAAGIAGGQHEVDRNLRECKESLEKAIAFLSNIP